MSSISPIIAFNKDAFPNRRHSLPAGPNHSACQSQPNQRAWRLRVATCCASLHAA